MLCHPKRVEATQHIGAMASTSMVAEAHSSKQRFVSSTIDMKVLLFHLQLIVDVEPFSHFYYNQLLNTRHGHYNVQKL